MGKRGYPDRWCARLTLADGRRKRIYRKTHAEVAQKLTKALHERDLGLSNLGDERQTVGQYLTRWLETTQPAVKPRTYDRYGQALRTHLIPALGSVKSPSSPPISSRRSTAPSSRKGCHPRPWRICTPLSIGRCAPPSASTSYPATSPIG